MFYVKRTLFQSLTIHSYVSAMSATRLLSAFGGRSVTGRMGRGFSTRSLKAASVLMEEVQNVAWIRLNRPERKNAFDIPMFEEATEALKSVARNEAISLAVVTGNGDFFSSGNDQSNLLGLLSEDPEEAKDAAQLLSSKLNAFIKELIDFPKPLIGAANGPGIGIAATMFGLVNCAVCSDNAYFWAPFSLIGIVCECCSSYTFPRIMGYSRAANVLMFNHKLTAQEALDCSLVSKVIPHKEFDSYLKEWIHREKGIASTCASNSLQATKSLVRDHDMRQLLHTVNENERKKEFLSPECIAYIKRFVR